MPEIPQSIKLPKQILQRRKGALGAIHHQIRTLLDVQAAVNSLLNADVKVASIEAGCLHLITPSAALATRLRYSQKTLLNGLRTRDKPFNFNQIKISVRPDLMTIPTPLTHEALKPNKQNAEQIAATAQYIEHEPLRKALLKLSMRGKSTN